MRYKKDVRTQQKIADTVTSVIPIEIDIKTETMSLEVVLISVQSYSK